MLVVEKEAVSYLRIVLTLIMFSIALVVTALAHDEVEHIKSRSIDDDRPLRIHATPDSCGEAKPLVTNQMPRVSSKTPVGMPR